MKVDCELLRTIHLDPGYALLSVQNCFTCMEMFNILDIHRGERLNDVQFLLFMRNITNLSKNDIEIIFNLLDIDHSGEIEFDEFYLVFCILIASKDSYEKEFIYRHSNSIFQLIDADGSGEISCDEFVRMGILFNFDDSAITRIFTEFDVSGDRNLDFAEFRLFTMACIDEARAQAARSKVKAYDDYQNRLVNALEPLLRRFVRTNCLPVPKEMEETIVHLRRPYVPGKRGWTLAFHSHSLENRFKERRERIRDWFIAKCGWLPCFVSFCWLCCCDFCCLDHPEDRIRCKLNCHCNCHCWKCWKHCFKSFIAACGCCHCCRKHVEHPNRHEELKNLRKLKRKDAASKGKKTEFRTKDVPKLPKNKHKGKGVYLL